MFVAVHNVFLQKVIMYFTSQEKEFGWSVPDNTTREAVNGLQLCVLVLCTIHWLIEGLEIIIIIIINHCDLYGTFSGDNLVLKVHIWFRIHFLSTWQNERHSSLCHWQWTFSSQIPVCKSMCTLIINIPFKLWGMYIH